MASAQPPLESSCVTTESACPAEGEKLFNIVEKEDANEACVEDFIKCREVVDLDERNKDGHTALMIACLHGKLDIVTYLLDEGANPHLITPQGNTAFHFACMYTPKGGEMALSEETAVAKAGNGENPSNGKDSTKKGLNLPPLTQADGIVLNMSLLLLSKKVKSLANHHGLYPLDIAALNKRSAIIAVFGSSNFLEKSETTRALNILGVTFALEDKCNIAFNIFQKAMDEYESNYSDNPEMKDFTSSLEQFFNQKECLTQRDLKALRKKKHAIKIQAFLVGDRVIPESMKPKVLYEPLAKYGHKLLFSRKTMEKGFAIFGACLHLERKGLFYLNTVLMYLRMSIPNPEILDNLEEPKFINNTCKTLATYVDVVEDVSCDHLKKSVKDLMCNLGRILYDVVDKYVSLETLERFLNPICKIISVIWGRIPKPEATGSGIVFPTISVCHNVLYHMGRENCPDFFFRKGNFSFRSCRYTSFLFKRLIAHLLHVEGALDRDCHGNTMVHTLMIYSQSMAPHIIEDILKLLIRHGCPTGAKNKEGSTPYDIISKPNVDSDDDDDDDDNDDEVDESRKSKMEILSNLMKGPTEVYSLQELAARSILCHRIPYQDKLPAALFTIFKDPILEEESEDEERECSDDCDSNSSEQSFDQNCSIS